MLPLMTAMKNQNMSCGLSMMEQSKPADNPPLQVSCVFIGQVRPVQNGWDHADLIGLDLPDFKRTGAELGKYYLGMINNMMRVEELDGLTKK